MTSSVRLFQRQRQLLLLLDAFGGRVRNLDFQKLLFLFCKQQSVQGAYDFVPYKFGAFSFTSYADRRKLIQRGFLEQDEYVWVLTPEGRTFVRESGETLLGLDVFVRQYRSLRGDALVAETYRRFPYYATRSEIAGKVLRHDTGTLHRIENARPAPAAAPLFTIGYEGHSIESYLNRLLQAGVSLLCDVRRNPISRKYGFSKGTLSKACVGVGIRYEHIPELGIASGKRQNLKTQADYDLLFNEYKRLSLPQNDFALVKIHDWIQSGAVVALTCYEGLPIQCHRHCVGAAMELRWGRMYSPRHL